MGFKDKIKRQAEKRLEKKATKVVEDIAGEGSEREKASRMADALREMIPIIGVPEMKRRVVAGVIDEWRDKKGEHPRVTVEELVKEYLEEPKAMALFRDLGMNENDLREMAQGVIDG